MSAETGDQVTGERDERLAVQGPCGPPGRQGNQGNRGERGMAGLSVPVRQAVVFLFVLSVLLGGLNLLWTAHEVHASQAAIQAAQQREQVAQQRAGVILGQKLCTTFGRLAALKPPAGNPATNPSRAYEDNLHVTLDELGVDLGCKLPLVPDKKGMGHVRHRSSSPLCHCPGARSCRDQPRPLRP